MYSSQQQRLYKTARTLPQPLGILKGKDQRGFKCAEDIFESFQVSEKTRTKEM